MSDLPPWQQNKNNFEEKTIDQILAFCGTGKLGNNNETSKELRNFLDRMPFVMLKKYCEECLSTSFKDNGLVLQDTVNQIGKRIGFSVDYGLYRGVQGSNGYDGLWRAIDGHHIIIEVKTTDTYRINLDIISNYRKMLIDGSKIDKEKSSILIVVGRQDTGDLEAQIRGSKHAWDIRVISIDALIKLMFLKEQLNNKATFNQINELLKPLEYTRVDNLIEITFNTSEDLLFNAPPNDLSDDVSKVTEPENLGIDIHSVKSNRANFHDLCINKVSKERSVSFIKQANSLFINTDNNYAIACMVSKEYLKKNGIRYWYAFHPYQGEFLEEMQYSSVVFGCGSETKTIEMPYQKFKGYLDKLRKTTKGTRSYWHVDILEEEGRFFLSLSKTKEYVNVTEYLLTQ